jgi:sugar lactone lactonase YvrE
VFATVTGSAGLNALTFDSAGNVYISDSSQGIIWRTGPGGGAATPWVADPLLTTTGVPPFGANGIAFNNAQTAMFVANTGNDQIIKIPVTGSPLVGGTPVVFVNSINGADGLVIDKEDNIWVCANQADEIVVVDPTGRVIAKLGDFGGIDPHGSPNGLLFPASLAFSGEFLYVSNLALDLRLFGLAEAVDSQWTTQVRRSTVARIRARIPPIPGLR